MKSKLDTSPPFSSSADDRRENDRGAEKRIFLVEDHPITRSGIAALINLEPDLVVCGEADAAPQAIELIAKARPDLALIDISLKSMSGIELLKNIRGMLPHLPVLIISMHDENIFTERALRAGANGYIMKIEASEKVLYAIRRVLEGELYLSENMKEKILRRLVKSGSEEVVFSMDTLSDRELEVFQLIGDGYGTRQIADRLNLSVKTIDSYREHLKMKLRLDSSAELVRHAIQWLRSETMA